MIRFIKNLFTSRPVSIEQARLDSIEGQAAALRLLLNVSR